MKLINLLIKIAILLVCISVNGKDLAFIGLHQGYWQVWLTKVQGPISQLQAHEAKAITTTPYDKGKLTWFPDGIHLLVNDNKGGLFIINSQNQKVSPVPLPTKGMMDAVVSPSGNRIAYSLSGSGSVGDNDIWLFDCAAKTNTKLTDMPALQHDPVFDSQESHLYFLSGKGAQVHDIIKLGLKTRNIEQLTSGKTYHFELAIDNDIIYFSNNYTGAYQIYAWDGKTKATALTDNKAFNGQASILTNTSWLAWTSSIEKGMQIWLMNTDNPEIKSRLKTPAVQARLPIWKPKLSNHANSNRCLNLISN